jgi:hypothetical protein
LKIACKVRYNDRNHVIQTVSISRLSYTYLVKISNLQEKLQRNECVSALKTKEISSEKAKLQAAIAESSTYCDEQKYHMLLEYLTSTYLDTKVKESKTAMKKHASIDGRYIHTSVKM